MYLFFSPLYRYINFPLSFFLILSLSSATSLSFSSLAPSILYLIPFFSGSCRFDQLASMKKVTSAAAKTLVKDEWVTTAMTDDEMVVELLIRLKHAGTVVSEDPSTNLPPLRWGVRQRRSRSSRFGVVSLKKDVDSARGSPKTPLSWSGGGSASPSADGFEDTSLQASCSTSTGSGSKVPLLSISFLL